MRLLRKTNRSARLRKWISRRFIRCATRVTSLSRPCRGHQSEIALSWIFHITRGRPNTAAGAFLKSLSVETMQKSESGGVLLLLRKLCEFGLIYWKGNKMIRLEVCILPARGALVSHKTANALKLCSRDKH
jgi:hypothetical protein